MENVVGMRVGFIAVRNKMMEREGVSHVGNGSAALAWRFEEQQVHVPEVDEPGEKDSRDRYK